MDPQETLVAGCKILETILIPSGFTFVEGASGKGSGGFFASGKFIKGNRALELHFRHSLGLVTYHIGGLSLTHEAYMRAALGPREKNKYPGFSNDPLDAFRDLASDLRNFCVDFLDGSGEQFAKYVESAREYNDLSGIRKLSNNES